jgi:pimeloyl-ACP methyl ester carboxylesterase
MLAPIVPRNSADYRREAAWVTQQAQQEKNGLVRTQLIGIAMGYAGVATTLETLERVRGIVLAAPAATPARIIAGRPSA